MHRAPRVIVACMRKAHLTHAGWWVWWWRVDSAEEQQWCSPSVRALRGFVRLLEFYTWSSNSLSCHHVCTKPMESCRCQRFWCHHFNLRNNHWSAQLQPLRYIEMYSMMNYIFWCIGIQLQCIKHIAYTKYFYQNIKFYAHFNVLNAPSLHWNI